jgi:uncharacterized protein
MAAPAIVKVEVDPKALPSPQGKIPAISSSQAMELLLANGAGLEARDVDGATPLIRAAESGNTDVVKLLLERGANVEARDKDGHTALIAAGCECASIDMPETIDVLRLLLAKNADVDARDSAGQTALMTAADAAEPTTFACY